MHTRTSTFGGGVVGFLYSFPSVKEKKKQASPFPTSLQWEQILTIEAPLPYKRTRVSQLAHICIQNFCKKNYNPPCKNCRVVVLAEGGPGTLEKVAKSRRFL